MQINRRTLMGWMGLTGGSMVSAPWLGRKMFAEDMLDPALALPVTAGPPTRWELSAAKKREQTKGVTWFTHEPLNFLLRRGDHSDDEPENYQRMIDPDNIRRMAAAGVTYGRLFFDKGFGIEYQKEQVAEAKQAADLMHKLGMTVSLYFGGSMFIETMYREVPEARNWEQRDQWNRWVPYGIWNMANDQWYVNSLQTYRHYACPNEPAYRDYLRRVLKIAIIDLRADEIAFDNVMQQPEPYSCRCPRCLKGFTAFLHEHYPTRDAMMRRFGLPDADWVHLTDWRDKDEPAMLSEVEDPVVQEWVRYRCVSMAQYANDLYDSVKKLNPKTSVLLNIKGVFSFNRYWTSAVYHPFYKDRIDLMAFDTNGYGARIDPVTGALVSQIRSYKVARQLGTSCEGSFHDDLHAAAHMAFGYQKPGVVPAPFGSGGFNAFTPLMEFFREKNERYYTGTDNVADVAVLRNWPSIAYSINATSVPVTLMEQVLIQYKVPFDLLFDEQLDHISKYGAVVLAGQECVSNAQAEQLLAYVRGGGTLVVAGNTGEFNEWRETRKNNPLLPARREGKGRIIDIPEIRRADVAPTKTGWQMNPSEWVLPQNHAEIYQSIISGMPAGLSVTTEAPMTTVMEVVNRHESRETMVHFVNFDTRRRIAPFAVTLRKQYDGPIKSAFLISPEREDAVPLTFQETGKVVRFTAPAMNVYSLIVVAQ